MLSMQRRKYVAALYTGTMIEISGVLASHAYTLDEF